MSLSDDLKDSILKGIGTSGAADAANRTIHPIVSDNEGEILSLTSGLPKIRASASSRFTLLFIIPLALKGLHNSEIRCCLCKKIISFPCWYYRKNLAVNNFHFFVCLDPTSSQKVNTHCWRIK